MARIDDRAVELRAWAEAQPYEDGWHWCVESYSHADYVRVLHDCLGSMDAARAALAEWVRRMVEREADCAW